MQYSICILTLALCFSLARAWVAYDPLSLENNTNASAKIANYPFYIQAFPYDFNCIGNLSFIQNPPPVDGQGINSYMENVSSILTVPADNTSVTCMYVGDDEPTCYSGDSPTCFSLSKSINKVNILMNDSSHVINNSLSALSTQTYYIITPNLTYGYLNSSVKDNKNEPYVGYESYLYPCDGNQTCMFDYLRTEITPEKNGSGFTYHWGKDKHFKHKEEFMDYFEKQQENTARHTNMSFIPPNLKPISNKRVVNQTELVPSLTSTHKASRLLYICLAFGLIMLSFR
ncbi:hypothetical protein SPOG_03618 [Schizosaccharomyces cryophilus OY26]|uniref:Uncharacterized protein n=1 Tax=Schizosaccharomyces cryophilus (strain OY26 / ATCC MYA-4695 / CBS 11777 / NBRC 106824 / NRRL Y48691) TaxID=653667 RepID=S9XHC0_SCHCR|nr:uncharacterized protein SPOG_03618 [Schizosaccharomyces cryophilus OY26]EPY53071.1 hypothetical protein SPOG_03618 [Schizosaccharomyces cryophilus OY26]